MRNAVADVSKSIHALPECFARLLYLGSLRDPNGDYEHWGLTREYGEKQTQSAFRQLHRAEFEGLLQTEFSDLIAKFKEHCESRGENYRLVIDQLSQDLPVSPSDVQEHSTEHFKYVLSSLLALAQSSC